MKAIKMIGLVAMVALMAMAFVGVTSAMAESTVLCSADESACAEGNVVKHVHEASVGKAKVLTSFGSTECNVLFLGDDVSEVMEEGAPLIISGSFTYTNCTLGGSSCTATEENGPAEIKVLKEGHETAKVTGEYLVHLVCGSTIDCSYNGTGLAGTIKGPLLSAQTPDNGETAISEASLSKEAGGFLCPKTTKLDITTTPLTETYVSTPANHYCVRLSRPSTGFYLGVSNLNAHQCINVDGTRLGQYDLVRTSLAFNSSEMICVRLNAEPKGFLKDFINKKECKDESTSGAWLFELGAVQ